MKKYIIILWLIFGLGLSLNAQDVNWRSLQDQHPHIVSLKIGADYSTWYGLAYGYTLNTQTPIVLGTEMTLPFGQNQWDDWKIGINGQAELWHNDRWSFAVKPGILVRRYQSDIARIYNTGAEITGTFGYYRPDWGLAAEANYDKTLFTHIEHKSLKDYYPAIRDGWYTSTGGNIRLGIKGNYTINSWNFWLKTGKVFGQDFKDNPTLPFYFELSVGKNF